MHFTAEHLLPCTINDHFGPPDLTLNFKKFTRIELQYSFIMLGLVTKILVKKVLVFVQFQVIRLLLTC